MIIYQRKVLTQRKEFIMIQVQYYGFQMIFQNRNKDEIQNQFR